MKKHYEDVSPFSSVIEIEAWKVKCHLPANQITSVGAIGPFGKDTSSEELTEALIDAGFGGVTVGRGMVTLSTVTRPSLHSQVDNRSEDWQFGRKCYSLPNHYERCSLSDSKQWPPLLPYSARGDVCFLKPVAALNKRIRQNVSHEVFHQRLKSVQQWFEEFSDVQRNRLLSDILPMCNARQLHLLSTWLCGDGRVTVESVTIPRPVAKADQKTSGVTEDDRNITTSGEECHIASDGEALQGLGPKKCPSTCLVASVTSSDAPPSDVESSDDSSCDTISPHSLGPAGSCRLHLGCPSNCQDPLSVLPVHVSFTILSYLDPQMLARAAQVSRVWRWVSNSPLLWHRLSRLPSWRLSPADHVTQLAKHTKGSVVNWKEVVVERWRVRRNWLGAHCHVRTFSGHSEGVACVQFDQHRIVSASHDNTIKVWSMRTNSQWPVQTLVGHSGRVRCLHLSDSRLVSGAADATIKVWEVEETSEWSSIVCRVTMTGHTDTVRCLQVCGNDTVVSGSYDHSVRVWSLPSGVCKRTLLGHTGAVLSLAVVVPLKLIVSGGGDNAIKVSFPTSRLADGHLLCIFNFFRGGQVC
ncbi:F-box domain [Trinorchestia longiramus]|nr:F-box domain [Trinorchestia longiramus]